MKRIYLILILVLLLVGCGKPVEETKNNTESVIKEEKSDSGVEEDDSDIVEDKAEKNGNEVVQEPNNMTNDSNTGTSTKPSTGSTTKPSTGATDSANNSNSTGNTTNNQNTVPNTGTTTPVHEHTWVEVTEEVKHYFDWRTICNVCKTDMTDMEELDRAYHVAVVCKGSYATYYKEVDFVTDNVQTETVVVGHKCACGELKEK